MSADPSNKPKSGPMPRLELSEEELEKLEQEARSLKQRLEEVTGRLHATIGARSTVTSVPVPAEERAPTFRALRVLVIEDEPQQRELLAGYVHRLGHQCQQASDGLEGLVELEGYRADVVVIDLMMPRIDGFTVARRIRRVFGADAPLLVAYTGHQKLGLQEAALAAGFDHFVQKPIKIEDLMFLLQQRPVRA